MSKKLLTFGAGLLIFLSLFAVALPTQAQVATNYSFTRDLTLGSTGGDVVQLQAFLVGKGFLVMPPGVAMGYFGTLTKSALGRYQASVGITPTLGYFGPITRANLNALAMGGTSNVPGCVPGAAFSSTTGQACTTSTSTVPGCITGALYSSTTGQRCDTPSSNGSNLITTPGVEGTLSVTSSNAGLPSSIYEGDSRAGILGLRVEARTSDIVVQRVRLDLGTSSAIYNKILSRIYLLDGSTVLASSDLNSNTVTREGSEYFITLTGFNSLVKRDTSKTLTVAADVRLSIDSTDRGVTRTISLDTNGIRGIDGAGIDQYSGGTSISRSFTISQELADSATLRTSLNSSSPAATTIIASSGSNQNEADRVTTLVFNLKAERDDVKVNDLTISATGTAVAAGRITTAYLYDGSTEIDNAPVSASTGLATFTNIDYTISRDSTRTLTVKVDVRNASASAETLTVSLVGNTTANIDAENSVGDQIASGYLIGSAYGEQMWVQKSGSVFTLVGTPTLTKSSIGNTASSTFLSSFTFRVAPQGSDVTVASTGAFRVGIYVNNVKVNEVDAIYTKPTSGVTGNGPYTISDGSSATFTAEYGFVAPAGPYVPAGAIVNARLESITTNLGTSTYVSDTYRTNSQTL